MSGGTLTGRKVAWIAGAVFATVLIPNVVMMVMAVKTFSGLVVPNSYIASQGFDADRDAQEALGWDVAVVHDDGILRLDLTDGTGLAVRPAALDVTIGRPTTSRDDRSLEMRSAPGGYVAEAELDHGRWRIEIAAVSADGTTFRQSRSLWVPR